MPRTDTKFKPATAEVIDRRGFASQINRVMKIVVQDQRADPHTSRGQRNRKESRKRSPFVINVVPDVDHIKPSGLC